MKTIKTVKITYRTDTSKHMNEVAASNKMADISEFLLQKEL
jgi:hypothetical protein